MYPYLRKRAAQCARIFLWMAALLIPTSIALAAIVWQTVGTAGFSAGQADHISFAFPDASTTPYIAYQDGGNSGKATVMKFDGTNWVNVGSAGFSGANAYAISLVFPTGSSTP